MAASHVKIMKSNIININDYVSMAINEKLAKPAGSVKADSGET
jgi:hypothetical protein